jgi:hypothetical protein
MEVVSDPIPERRYAEKDVFAMREDGVSRMSARVEAAAKVWVRRDGHGLEIVAYDRETARHALAAADAVMFSDEAVERAAEEIHAAICDESLEDHLDPDWPGRCVKAAEATITALKGDNA